MGLGRQSGGDTVFWPLFTRRVFARVGDGVRFVGFSDFIAPAHLEAGDSNVCHGDGSGGGSLE